MGEGDKGGYVRNDDRLMNKEVQKAVDPMRLACMMLARDGKSMHRKEYLDEADRIVKAIYGLTVKSGHRRIIYRQICEPYCFGTEAFKTFKEYFDRQYKMAVEYGYFSSLYNLTYPYSTIIQERMPIDNFFFGVRLIDQNETEAAKNKSRIKRVVDWLEYWVKTYDIDRTRPIEYQITNMEHVTVNLSIFSTYEYPDLNMTVYEEGGMFVDQMLSLKRLTVQRDSRSEVKGGISVQVALKSMAEKVEHTVLSVAWPMVQAGLSTVCCVLPLTFAAVGLTV
ncbi:hypothetical protein NECAME_12845 [Necator americanus]|uniref:Uncharacterized protein n=1 Tax=Necator americanus TaxID=51031 RepID=W2T031_NECAM|nr:hypothetical protein NECAME_12845 [Necator americanus]ETN74621.1 hypothetical protein NECAME_12845 [Necator americanus]